MLAVFFVVLSLISGFLTVKIFLTEDVSLLLPIQKTKTATIKTTSPLAFNHPAFEKRGTGSFADLLNKPAVLGEATASAEVDKETQETGDTLKKLSKSEYTIALLGDSMFDTLGPGIPHLKKILQGAYPRVHFTLHNYGVGGSDILSGLARLDSEYTYMGEKHAALLSLKPDVVILESFAYNHWENTKSDLDKHWLTIAKIVQKIRSTSPGTKIVLAATIAPYCPTYTDGSANLPPDRKFKQCETVKEYLNNMVRFAKSEDYPLIDAYHASLGTDGNGFPAYINSGDHIHPSDKGKLLFAQKAAAVLPSVLE